MRTGQFVEHKQGNIGILLEPSENLESCLVYDVKLGTVDKWPTRDLSQKEGMPEHPLAPVYVVNQIAPAHTGIGQITGGILLANLITGVTCAVLYFLFHGAAYPRSRICDLGVRQSISTDAL